MPCLPAFHQPTIDPLDDMRPSMHPNHHDWVSNTCPSGHLQDSITAADGLLPVPDVTLNVANVRLAQQDYYSAIQMYQACLRRHHHNKDATVLLYLARCV